MSFVRLAFCICDLCDFLNRMCDRTVIFKTLSEITGDVWVILLEIMIRLLPVILGYCVGD